MPKNFLMMVDMTSVAALNFILRYGYYFQLHLASRAAASRKNLCIMFRDHIVNAVPKKFTDLYWSQQLKNSAVKFK